MLLRVSSEGITFPYFINLDICLLSVYEFSIFIYNGVKRLKCNASVHED